MRRTVFLLVILLAALALFAAACGDSDNNDGEDIERPDADDKGGKSKPVSPGHFRAALSLRSLPLPNYTSADIMAEESANQQRRARQKAARAGAKVEKNW